MLNEVDIAATVIGNIISWGAYEIIEVEGEERFLCKDSNSPVEIAWNEAVDVLHEKTKTKGVPLILACLMFYEKEINVAV